MKKKIKKSLLVDNTRESLLDFRDDNTDFDAASYDLFINNAIGKISFAFIELF